MLVMCVVLRWLLVRLGCLMMMVLGRCFLCFYLCMMSCMLWVLLRMGMSRV